MHTKGFTLIEMIVVVALTGSVGVGLLLMISYFYRSNAYLIEATSATESASEGIVVTLESLREATYGEDGSYPLAAAATSSVTFYADLDLDESVERVQFYVANGTLYRSLTEPAGNPPSYSGQTPVVTTIAPYVKNGTSTPAFRYFDRDGVELTGTVDIAAVRTVRTRFEVDINPLRAPNVVSFEGAATLRNVRNAD
ncbi:MAG TPA: prepilin-type N-terminal cleavage/methylation domain-containing protein [Candidatus Paceibacterota bacterium]|nr:prepilin-type N-terminal cleavage/methylation domain-containing protein [Candidatus Paceibacterota bacterium]